MKLGTRSVEETRSAGAALASVLEPGDVVVLAGDLGAGKTAFAQGVARGLGVEETVASPSFVIVRQYEGRLPLAHVDVYRLDRIQELHDLGFDELIDGSGVVLVEWGDRISPLLPDHRIEVTLGAGAGPDEREVEVVARGREWARREGRLTAALHAYERP